MFTQSKFRYALAVMGVAGLAVGVAMPPSASASSLGVATATEPAPHVDATSGLLANDVQYSDEDVLKLLFAGQGKIADENPDLVKYLGFDPSRPTTDADALDQVITMFLSYYPGFNEEVHKPLVSGSPRAVENSLKRLTSVYRQFAVDELGLKKSLGDTTQGPCDGGAKVCTVAWAGAVVAGGIYTTAAVATFVLAAAAAVFVVGPVAYLDDKTSPYYTMTSLEKDMRTARIAKALAQ